MNIEVYPPGAGTVKVTATPVPFAYGKQTDYLFEAQVNPGYMLNSRRINAGETPYDWEITVEYTLSGLEYYTWKSQGLKATQTEFEFDEGGHDKIVSVKLILMPAPKGILRDGSWITKPQILRMDGSILRGNGV